MRARVNQATRAIKDSQVGGSLGLQTSRMEEVEARSLRREDLLEGRIQDSETLKAPSSLKVLLASRNPRAIKEGFLEDLRVVVGLEVRQRASET